MNKLKENRKLNRKEILVVDQKKGFKKFFLKLSES